MAQSSTPSAATIHTLGVYGFSEDEFFDKLTDNEIDLFIDIRARRGMRGSRYKFVNSAYLQAQLKERGIHYAHLKELAPTKEIRALQWQADKREKTRKRERTALSTEYIAAYKKQVLKYGRRKAELILDPSEVLEQAKRSAGYPDGKPLQRYVFFCVESSARACHRSLVARRFKDKIGGKVKHL